jgi:hypothetical protein
MVDEMSNAVLTLAKDMTRKRPLHERIALLGAVRSRLRGAFFRLLRRVADSDDAKAIQVSSLQNLLPRRPAVNGRDAFTLDEPPLAMVLCYSRRSFVAFFRDERLPTLLWAHQEAFRDHQGLCRRIVYANQTAITLGRVRGQPRWHPTFLAFARHYGFERGRPARPQGAPRQGQAALLLPRGRLPARPHLRSLGRPPLPGPPVAGHRGQCPRARHDAPARRRGLR